MKGEMEPLSGSLNRRRLQRRREEVDKETIVLGHRTRRRLTCTEETGPLAPVPPPPPSVPLPVSHLNFLPLSSQCCFIKM